MQQVKMRTSIATRLLGIVAVICASINDSIACPYQPANCKDGMVKFMLLVKHNDAEEYELLFEPKTVKEAPIKRYDKIKILFMENVNKYDSQEIQSFKEEYARRHNVKVIAVDYTKLGEQLSQDGHTMEECLPFVAYCAATMLRAVERVRPDIQWPQIHVIAYGSAACIPGHMAEYLADFNIGPLERVTVLEPTYSDRSFISHKTHIKSALFVDVYHTNAGGISVDSSSAHLEVYFNDGRKQPGCTDDECSHRMVLEYYKESVNSEAGFYGVKCLHYFHKTCAKTTPAVVKLVGEHAYVDDVCTAFVKQVFVVITNDAKPYARGPIEKRIKSHFTLE